jgi:hypothetical protein
MLGVERSAPAADRFKRQRYRVAVVNGTGLRSAHTECVLALRCRFSVRGVLARQVGIVRLAVARRASL